MVKSNSQQGYEFKQSFAFLAMLFLLSIPTICSQKILIEKLDSFTQSNTGVQVNLRMNSTEESGLAVFGWIRVNSTTETGDIFQVYSNVSPSSESESKVNKLDDLLFSTQYLSWGSNFLQFSHNFFGNERLNKIDLSPKQLKEWIFVYAGHSFQHKKRSYFVRKGRNSDSQIVFDIDTNQQQFYSITAGTNRFLDKQYFIGDFERLTVYIGDYAYRETDYFDFHYLHPQDFSFCSLSFEMCAYLGLYDENCEESGFNLKKTIKSTLLEKGKSFKGCVDTNEGKQMIQFNKSVECVTKDNINELSTQGQITFIEHNSNENPCEN